MHWTLRLRQKILLSWSKLLKRSQIIWKIKIMINFLKVHPHIDHTLSYVQVREIQMGKCLRIMNILNPDYTSEYKSRSDCARTHLHLKRIFLSMWNGFSRDPEICISTDGDSFMKPSCPVCIILLGNLSLLTLTIQNTYIDPYCFPFREENIINGTNGTTF